MKIASAEPVHIARKRGRVVSQVRAEGRVLREGRERSARRVMRGPELGLGAAMRVRREDEGFGMAFCVREVMVPVGRRRRRGSIVMAAYVIELGIVC